MVLADNVLAVTRAPVGPSSLHTHSVLVASVLASFNLPTQGMPRALQPPPTSGLQTTPGSLHFLSWSHSQAGLKERLSKNSQAKKFPYFEEKAMHKRLTQGRVVRRPFTRHLEFRDVTDEKSEEDWPHSYRAICSCRSQKSSW